MLDVDKVSIEWNDGNAKLIIKLVEELGYSVYRNTSGEGGTRGWSYFAGSSG